LKGQFGEGLEVGGGHREELQEGGEEESCEPAQPAEQQGLRQEGHQDRRALKSHGPQGADLCRTVGYRRVHRDHGPDALSIFKELHEKIGLVILGR
jgi:hypothetical protein